MNRMRSCCLLLLALCWESTAFLPTRAISIEATRSPAGIYTAARTSTMMAATDEPASPHSRKPTQVQASSMPISYRRQSILGQVKQAASNAGAKIRSIDEVAVWRTAALAFVSSILIFHNWYDSGLVNAWQFLQTSPALFARAFRHDHWEWALSVSAIAAWIHGFWFADRMVIGSGKRGRVHPWRKFRLQDRYEAQKLNHEMDRRLERGEQGSEDDITPPLHTKPSAWNWKGWICELPVYCVPLYLWDILAPRRAAKIAAWGAPTAFQVCRDVTCGLLIYDMLFFTGHVLMHKIPLLYNLVHKKHHVNPEVRAGEIVRLSVPEEVLEVGFSIIALNFLKAHPISRSIYNCIITFLLVELHSGFDFPWTPQNVVPFGLATGSRRHHYHHRFGRHYYQKFFFHVDRLLGFHQKNDGSLLGDSIQPFDNPPPSWVAES